jgi:DNA-binding IclR family transcriptional regulator
MPENNTQPLGSTLGKALSIFDLISTSSTTIHVAEVAKKLNLGKSTAYRYLSELSEYGFLSRTGSGEFSIGPRVIELEKLLRLSDPVFLAGQQVLESMAPYCDNRVLCLCTLYRNRVLCTYQVGGDTIRFKSQRMKVYRDRGTALPLFQGAGSQVILAHLPVRRAQSLFLANVDIVKESGMGNNWKDFRQHLARIRKSGFAQTYGRVNTHSMSLAVPILLADGTVAASLLLIASKSPEELKKITEHVNLLKAASTRISSLIDASTGTKGAAQ